jgi:hypothetical protein
VVIKKRGKRERAGVGVKSTFILVMILVMMLQTSCGTIRYGVKQKVGIASSPLGASVTVDDKPYGETPVLIHLSRNRQHRVKIELTGHPPYETVIKSRIRGSEAVNYGFGLAALVIPVCASHDPLATGFCLILFLPVWVISLGVDAVAGGLYDLTPDQIVAPLDEK